MDKQYLYSQVTAVKSRIESRLWLLLLVLLAIILTASYFQLVRVELASAAVSGLLTLALVQLYSRQTDIQEQQTQIMENQEGLMEVEHRPQIDVDSFYPAASIPSGTDENMVTIGLENVGKGVGINASLKTAGVVDCENMDLGIERTGMTTNYRKDEEESPFEGLSDALKPGRSKMYAAPVQVYDKKEERTDYIDEVAYRAYLSGASLFVSHLSILFNDLRENDREFSVVQLRIDLDQVATSAKGEPSVEDFSFVKLFFNGFSEAKNRLYEDKGTLPWPNKTDWIAKNLIESQATEESDETADFK